MPARSAYDEHLIAAWLTAQVGSCERGPSEAPAEINGELRRQLEALGYVE
jgi:hypothetical protein